ncbi:hypothetical protein [uncultured Gimesia sp.]|uniref:hypothetical protein n=1 Tax=uncultured Gimesia sp. TaxID=1678688 RepID=UPI002611618B|nr:hypothetical protein [uncultured Gimesia sp.]
MAKNKQQKKKEREKRVAKEKHAASAKKRTQEKTAKASLKPATQRSQIMSAAVPKAKPVVTNSKSSFTQRRTGG